MGMVNRSDRRERWKRSTPVVVGLGWMASLVGYLIGRVLIAVIGPAQGWVNLLLVLVVPVLSALAGTLVLPPGWLRGTKGALRHALIVLPVPLAFTLIGYAQAPEGILNGGILIMMSVVMIVGALGGALLGRRLRREPDHSYGGSY